MHPSITEERITDAAIRTAFGIGDASHLRRVRLGSGCVEPDARKHVCESCGKRAVYGAQQLLPMPRYVGKVTSRGWQYSAADAPQPIGIVFAPNLRKASTPKSPPKAAPAAATPSHHNQGLQEREGGRFAHH